MSHVHAGRLNGIHAELGAVLGPKEVTREYVVVTGNDEHGLTLGYARTDDLDEAAIRGMVERGPMSVAEHRIVAFAQEPVRARLRDLLGPLVPAVERPTRSGGPGRPPAG